MKAERHAKANAAVKYAHTTSPLSSEFVYDTFIVEV